MVIPSSELLRGLTPEQEAEVLVLSTARQAPRGSVVFELGAEAGEIFLILAGQVKLTLPVQAGGQSADLLVEERTSGQLLGWSALIPPHRFTLKGTAQQDTQLLALPRQPLLHHFAAHPEVGYIVLSNLARVIGQRLQVFQTMWGREMQHLLEKRAAPPAGEPRETSP